MSKLNQEAKFPTGKFAVTFGIHEKMNQEEAFNTFVKISIGRHITGDWGEIHPEDEGLNDMALEDGSRILSVYKSKELKETIWIITEADRTATTVLFPREY